MWFIDMLCLSFMNEVTEIVSLSKFNADVDSGKWNINRNAMFTQEKMTTASTTDSLCFLSTLFMCTLCIVYSIYSTLFICKHFVLYSRKTWAQFDMHLSACRINICRASADELCHVTQHVSALSPFPSLSPYLPFIAAPRRVSSFNAATVAYFPPLPKDAIAREMLPTAACSKDTCNV